LEVGHVKRYNNRKGDIRVTTKHGRIEKIISAMEEAGATRTILIKARDVVVDERVRLKCRVPICEAYGQNLMCPPHVPPVEEFRGALAEFSDALLIQFTVSLPQDPNGRKEDVFAAAKRLHELVNLGEKTAFEEGFRFATGLIGGCCRLCDECEGVKPGGRCTHPFKARPSMEAMGIDVTATTEEAGLAVPSYPIDQSVTWTGLILL
jgi:predicted metal-binding protein